MAINKYNDFMNFKFKNNNYIDLKIENYIILKKIIKLKNYKKSKKLSRFSEFKRIQKPYHFR